MLKSKDIFLANRNPSSQSYVFSSKESWAPKNWCFWTVVLEETLESPLKCKEIQTVHPKGNQSWIFIERTDTKAEPSILWSLDAKNWLIGKDSDAGKDWGQEEKGTTEDEMDGWQYRSKDINLTKLRRWWRTGMLGMLQSLGSKRVGHDSDTVLS